MSHLEDLQQHYKFGISAKYKTNKSLQLILNLFSMTRAERRFNQKRKWLSRAKKLYNTWKARSILYYMRSGNLELPQYSTFQNFLDSHKLIKNTVTPNSNPFNDKEGWKHDRREVKARNRKIRHNKKNYISNELE